MFASRSIPPAATQPSIPMSVPVEDHAGWYGPVRNKKPRSVREFRTVYVQTVTPDSENNNQEDKGDMIELLQQYPVNETQVKSAEPVRSKQRISDGLAIRRENNTADSKDRDFIVKVFSFVLEFFTPSPNFRGPRQPSTKTEQFDFLEVWAEIVSKKQEPPKKSPNSK